MAIADIDGIETYYEIKGDGPPLLLCAPGGFDADSRKWDTQGIYSRLRFLDHLPEHFKCIVFDRRDTGRSSGRVEAVTWTHYAHHAKRMLDYLGIETAHIMGGCMGCTVATAFAAAYPDSTRSLVLFWPVGGAKYRINGHIRFAQHLAYVEQNGMQAVVDLAQQEGKAFGKDPRVGPWVSAIQTGQAFADTYARFDVEQYKLIVTGMARALLDRDTAPGAEPEQLLRLDIPTLIIPGADDSHATSAARYLEECIPSARYWDASVNEQTPDAILPQTIDFIGALEGNR